MSTRIECVVVAPSKLQRPVGDRVKTDARDALHLARLLHLGEVVSVKVPTIEEETARDLVRSREDTRQDLMGARHRLWKLLLRHGFVYSDGAAWTGRHDVWLRAHRAKKDYDYRPRSQRAAKRVGDTDPVLPRVQRAISNFKSWLRGTHRSVSNEHLQVYLDEFTFRYNR
jgi:transposase